MKIGNFGFEVRLVCIPGNHAVDLTLSELLTTLLRENGSNEPGLPTGWEHLPADIIEDPTGGVPMATYNPDSHTLVPVCPEHVAAFKTSAAL